MCILLTVGLLVASFVLTQLLAPKPRIENARPAGLGDFQAATATEARTQPLVFGTVLQRGPNVVWFGDLEQVPITQSVKKNLFSKSNVTVGYKYYLGIQFGIFRGDDDTTLKRILIGGKEVWSGSVNTVTAISINKPDLFGGDTLGAGGVVGTFRYHPGTSDQAVNAYLEDFQFTATGSTRTPNYGGLAYGVFEHGYVGNSTSLKEWSFELKRVTNGLNLDLAEYLINGADSNPMNVIYELITNTEWGFGDPAATIDLVNFEDCANTLAAENCGFSMLVDTGIGADSFKEELERQINGAIYIDHTDGKWRCKLARDDYNVNTVPELVATGASENILEVEDFTRGGWLDTSNQVRLFFFDRQNDYDERPAFAADMANAMIQGGGTVLTMRNQPTEVRFPGIKDAGLANQTVWRVLRSLSYPLAKAKITVDRSLWDLRRYDVVTWTDEALGFTKLPMRVQSVDLGNLEAGEIVLDLVQDIWRFAAGSFGDPPATGWTPPTDELEAFDSVFAFEAPRAFLTRAVGFNGTYSDRVVTAAKRKGAEVGYELFQKVGAASYVTSGIVDTTVRVGTLTSSLPLGDISGVSINVTCATAADKAAILAAFNSGLGVVELGTQMLNLLRIGNEFLIAKSAASGTGTTIDFTDVYRQVVDSVQVAHSSSTEVWATFMGVGITEQSYASGDVVDVKLLPTSRSDQVPIASVTAASVTMANRLRRPLPPGRIALNGANNDTTNVSLEGVGSGDATGILLELIRRDYRSTDEIQALTLDASSITTSFPADVTYTFTVAVYNTTSTPTLLFTTAAQSAASITIRRTEIFRWTSSAIPTSLRIDILTSHVYGGVTYTARSTLAWEFTTTSALTGLFNLGTINDGISSNTYTADASGTWQISIATAMTTGNVQVNVAGAGFVNVITTGNLTGTFSANSSDSIVVKHSESTSGYMTALLIRNPSSTPKAYGVAFKT